MFGSGNGTREGRGLGKDALFAIFFYFYLFVSFFYVSNVRVRHWCCTLSLAGNTTPKISLAAAIPPVMLMHFPPQERLQERVAHHASEKGLLLVCVKDLPTSGSILSERQRRWITTAPYDYKTENPILYKSVPSLQYCAKIDAGGDQNHTILLQWPYRSLVGMTSTLLCSEVKCSHMGTDLVPRGHRAAFS